MQNVAFFSGFGTRARDDAQRIRQGRVPPDQLHEPFFRIQAALFAFGADDDDPMFWVVPGSHSGFMPFHGVGSASKSLRN